VLFCSLIYVNETEKLFNTATVRYLHHRHTLFGLIKGTFSNNDLSLGNCAGNNVKQIKAISPKKLWYTLDLEHPRGVVTHKF